MPDNAPCHRANIVSEWLSEQDIEVTAWPPRSPSTTKEDLWKNLKSVWDVIPVTEVIKAKRCHTKY